MKQYDSVPDVLKQHPNWVVWGLPGMVLKAPFNPEKLLKSKAEPAMAGIPDTWGSFESAVRCVRQGLAQGIGYEFDGRGIFGVDLDHVIDDNGVIVPAAKQIVDSLSSYTEISPSGHGLHIFITADDVNITRHRKQGGFVEIYTKARYFTVTGNTYGDYNGIANRPSELQMIHDEYLLPEPVKAAATQVSVGSPRYASDTLKRGLTRDSMLRALWNGEHRGSDESSSDQALMNKLGYWCNANHDAMIEAFLQSPYYDSKSEAHKIKCERADYLPNTAKKACESLRSTAHADTLLYRQAKYRNKTR